MDPFSTDKWTQIELTNTRLQRYCNFYDILYLILNIDEDLKEAYYFMLRLDTFFRESTLETAKESLDSIINSANSSHVIEINTFGNTLINWRKEIINSFYIVQKSTDKNGNLITRKINNGIAENKNRTLKLLKNHSNGYKSWERFRNRALYVLNDDATYSLNPIK